ncbi:NUDIX domain-containing protein [Psychromonas antarctica]|uniref:NUDIX domain-containing protein n=1 Tax=Psychromonas antarctica TaxID=67573 RepID=UPI001EE84928|nr:NUDIX hydrolase [Psychromonas antarctica]
MSEIKQLNSKIVYQNKWMTIREDKIIRPSGAEGIYSVLDKVDFVVIVPVQDNHIYLVEQYRYPVKGRYWELPQGSLEGDLESQYVDAAKRELREETGLISSNMVYVGYQFLACGHSSQGYHIYLATDLEQGANDLDPEEEDLLTKKVTIEKFEEMLRTEVIKDATTLNAYSLAKLKGLL